MFEWIRETLLGFFTKVLPLKRRPYTLLLIVLLPGILIIFLDMTDLECPKGSKLYAMCDLLVFGSMLFILFTAIITAIVAIVKGWVRGWVRIIIVLALIVYIAFFLSVLAFVLAFLCCANDTL